MLFIEYFDFVHFASPLPAFFFHFIIFTGYCVNSFIFIKQQIKDIFLIFFKQAPFPYEK
ncbi:hypothetical protein B4110_2940 [Parageobacillus toebii]|uniref:Uncharacterized protein n=1 Tax=Parageobacillus toebii TaxID=153151 RepID=A0A150MT80_9BACL|nr:hypothetical protein B4110_2940 [Parageobacillus toebii]